MKLGQYLLKSPETSSVRLRATVLAAITLIVLPLATLVAPMPFGVVVQGVVAAQNEHYLNADTPGVFESVNVEPGTFVNQDDVLATLSNAEVTADYQLTQASLQEVLLQWEVTHGQNIVEASRYEPRIKELKHQLLETQRQVAELELVAPGPGLVARALPGSQHGRYIQTGETIAIVVNGRPVLRTWLSEDQLGSVKVEAGTTVAFRIPGQSGSTLTGRLLSIEPAAEHSNLSHALTYLAGGEILLNPQTGLSMDPMFQLDIEPNEQSALHLSNHGMRISLNLPRRYEPIASWVVRRVTRFVQKTLLA
jgi:multidrug resistance efflux pump